MTREEISSKLRVWKRGMDISTLSSGSRKVFKAIPIETSQFVVVNGDVVLPSFTKFYSSDADSGFIQLNGGLEVGEVLLKEGGAKLPIESILTVDLDEPLSLSMPYVKADSFAFLQGVCVFLDNLESSGPSTSGGCVSAGTLISMADGSTKPVEDLRIGDLVLSYNEVDKDIEPKKVLGLDAPIVDGTITLNMRSGTSLTLTKDHPVFSRKPGHGIGWAAYDPYLTRRAYPYLRKTLKLCAGDFVRTSAVEWDQIVSVTERRGKSQAYNVWAVEGNRNYFANGLLVHNKGSFISKSTYVETEDKGKTKVSELAPGDRVLSYCEWNGERGFKKLRGVSKHSVEEYWRIKTIAGHSVYISEDQLIYARTGVGEEGWRAIDLCKAQASYPYVGGISELITESELYRDDGTWHPIFTIDLVQERADSVVVWDVEDNLNLYANGFLFHNRSSDDTVSYVYEGAEILLPADNRTPILHSTPIIKCPPPAEDAVFVCGDLVPGDRVAACVQRDGSVYTEVRSVKEVVEVDVPSYYRVGVRISDGEEHVINLLPHQPILLYSEGSESPRYAAIDPDRSKKAFPYLKHVSELSNRDKIHLSGNIYGEVLYSYTQGGHIRAALVIT